MYTIYYYNIALKSMISETFKTAYPYKLYLNITCTYNYMKWDKKIRRSTNLITRIVLILTNFKRNIEYLSRDIDIFIDEKIVIVKVYGLCNFGASILYVMFMREIVYCLRKHIFIETVEHRKYPSTKSFSFISNDKHTVVK